MKSEAVRVKAGLSGIIGFIYFSLSVDHIWCDEFHFNWFYKDYNKHSEQELLLQGIL